MKIIFIKSLLSLICTAAILLAGTPARAQAVDAPSKPPAAAKSFVKNVDANEAENILKENKKIVVLDVRTSKEFAAGHIAGATNINFFDANFKKDLDALDKNQPYLVHCAVGGRSAKARELMKTLHFTSIYHLEGGIKAWEKAGKPVEPSK